VKFNVITFNEVFESGRSESRAPLPYKGKLNAAETLAGAEESKELAWNYTQTGD